MNFGALIIVIVNRSVSQSVRYAVVLHCYVAAASLLAMLLLVMRLLL